MSKTYGQASLKLHVALVFASSSVSVTSITSSTHGAVLVKIAGDYAELSFVDDSGHSNGPGRVALIKPRDEAKLHVYCTCRVACSCAPAHSTRTCASAATAPRQRSHRTSRSVQRSRCLQASGSLQRLCLASADGGRSRDARRAAHLRRRPRADCHRRHDHHRRHRSESTVRVIRVE